MAQIIHFTANDVFAGTPSIIDFDGSLGEWVIENYESKPIPFCVFEGTPCLKNKVFLDENTLLNSYGSYTVIDTAADPVTASIIVSVVISVAAIVLTPKPEMPNNVSRQQQSPNNQLSNRSNQARPNQRVPDIKGEVKSIPDIIAPTYSTYENNIELEHGFYCVGRKQIQVEELSDADTPLELIDQATAGIYYPGNSPNIGPPDESIGSHVSEAIVSAYRSNQISGITLSSDFDDGYVDYTETPAVDTDTNPNYFQILYDGGAFVPWPSVYEVGGFAELTNYIVDGTDLSGTYQITSLSVLPFGGLMTLDYGAAYPLSGPLAPTSGSIQSTAAKEYTDWAYMTAVEFNRVNVNITAPNGMYIDTGSVNLTSRTVEYELQIEGVDSSGTPDGSPTILTGSISGNNQSLKGVTQIHDFTIPTRFRIRAKRTTPRYTGSGNAIDQIKLEDVYGMLDIDNETFGDTTTIQTLTVANALATAVKERQLNCKATEMLYEYTGGGAFSGVLTANKIAMQSYITDAIDPVIGNRTLSEVDADGLLSMSNDIESYFGSEGMNEFSYTFDSTDITFQDYTQIVFDSIFSFAFREGNVIKGYFEQPQKIPSMLFTHRSKIPDSETYTRKFNSQNVNDGIEFDWVNPDTDTTETIFIPADRSATKPKKFEIPGIRNEAQAVIRAAREYNKIIYGKESLQFTSSAEGRYAKLGEMISVVKGSRVYTEDGDILAQDGLNLTLSQDVVFDPSETYSIILKQDDGTTEAITVTEGPKANSVILASLPSEPIRASNDNVGSYNRSTEFSFGSESRALAQLWIPQEVDIAAKYTVGFTCINYTNEYYKNDLENLSGFDAGFDEGFGQ